MIDMSSLYEHSDYSSALANFEISNCKWSSFESVHRKVSKDKCPICQCDFTKILERDSHKGKTEITATIDHYRPQKYYSFLSCEDKNYILMCSECNNIYKGSLFPLYHSTNKAICKEELSNEKPLIVNPIVDNPLDLFILVFNRSSSGNNLLELHPKEESGYLYEKAKETIKVFGLGNCEINRHKNENVFQCRITLLKTHFGIFNDLVTALMSKDKKAFRDAMENKELFESYGFYEFIKRKQFKINTI